MDHYSMWLKHFVNLLSLSALFFMLSWYKKKNNYADEALKLQLLLYILS